MRKSSIYAIVGYALTVGACVLTFFGVKASIDGFNKKDELQDQYRLTYGQQAKFEEEHSGEDLTNNAEYQALVSDTNAAKAKVNDQDKNARTKFWAFSVPSILLPLLCFSITTAIWTEKQKEDL